MTAAATQQPPAHLSKKMRDWWEDIEATHGLEPHHRHLLQLAAEAFDRAEGARKVIEGQGAVFLDRFNQAKARPETVIERDCRRDFAAIVKQLNFDEEPPK